MVTGTRARSYEEMVDALAEGLPMLQDTLSGLTPEDWQRPTLLRPPEPGTPPWTVLQLAAHFDVFMGLQPQLQSLGRERLIIDQDGANRHSISFVMSWMSRPLVSNGMSRITLKPPCSFCLV